MTESPTIIAKCPFMVKTDPKTTQSLRKMNFHRSVDLGSKRLLGAPGLTTMDLMAKLATQDGTAEETHLAALIPEPCSRPILHTHSCIPQRHQGMN